MSSKIEQQVMAGVGAIYIARQLTSKVALEFYALVVAALALWRLVWVHQVINNFLVELRAGSVANYILVALEHAHFGVLLVLAVAACALALLCVDVARARLPAHTFA